MSLLRRLLSGLVALSVILVFSAQTALGATASMTPAQIQANINNVSQEISSEKLNLQNVQNQLNPLEDTQSQISKLQSDISSLQNQEQSLANQESQLENETADTIQAANDTIGELSADIVTLNAQIQTAEQNGQTSLELQLITTELGDESQELNLKQEIGNLQNTENTTLENISSQLSNLPSQISSDQSSLDSLQNQNPNLGSEISNLQNQEQGISATLSSLQGQLDSLLNELNQDSQNSSGGSLQGGSTSSTQNGSTDSSQGGLVNPPQSGSSNQQPSLSTQQSPSSNISVTFQVSSPFVSVAENDSTEAMVLPTAPTLTGSQPYIPLESLAKAIGAVLSWNPSTGRANLITGTSTVSFWIGSSSVLVDGAYWEQYSGMSPVVGSNSTPMIPALFAGVTLDNGGVSYNQATGTITISGKSQPSLFAGLSGVISKSTIGQLANMFQSVNGRQVAAQTNVARLLELADQSLKNGQTIEFGPVGRLTSAQNLLRHYRDHANEFRDLESVDASTKEGYQQIGQGIVDAWDSGSSDVRAFLYFYKNDGGGARIGLYDESNNIFVSLQEDANGALSIATIFRPTSGSVYLSSVEAGLNNAVSITRQTLDEIAQFLMQAGEEVPPM